MRSSALVSHGIAALLIALVPSVVAADYVTLDGSPVTQGQLRIASDERARLGDEAAGTVTKIPTPVDRFVLKETRVKAEIAGVLARVHVEQVFQNPYPDRLEATYVFPLPQDAAIDGYSFQIGETVIAGVVKKRDEARREYEKARDEGRKGALLEQERPNIFTQSVANIPPGAEVTVRIHYVHPVKIDDKSCLFRFPMVVGPRFMPGDALARPNLGRGWAPDTTVVPDASRISPPVLRKGERLGNDVFIDVSIDAGMPIQGVTAVTHELEVEQPSPTTAAVRLKNASTIANKDFVVEYSIAGPETVLATLTHRAQDSEHGYVALVLQPKRDIAVAELTPREVVLVLDQSGSMNGTSISQLRIMAEAILGAMNPQDTFRVVAFNNQVTIFHGDALPATLENIATAKDFVRRLQAGGGTNMLPALQTALRARGEEARPRYLMLLSDALVGDDDRILGYLASRRLADTRVFPVAIGSAPNHYLIRRAAEIGRGFSMYLTNQDNPVAMAKRFNEKTSTPYLTDLRLDWGGLDVDRVSPDPLPDLYAGEPLVVTARYRKPGASKITLQGNLAGNAVGMSLDLTLPEEELEHDALPSVWARRRIAQLWNLNVGKETNAAEAEITRIGLEHQLVTKYTSFVAVESQAPATIEGELLTESVPTVLPEGMTEDATPAEAYRRKPAQPQVRQPKTHNPVVVQAPPPTRQAPTQAPSRPRRTRGDSGGGGFGGSVEWVFLAGLGLLGGARAARRRRENEPEV